MRKLVCSDSKCRKELHSIEELEQHEYSHWHDLPEDTLWDGFGPQQRRLLK